jgi:hypothetical protein
VRAVRTHLLASSFVGCRSITTEAHSDADDDSDYYDDSDSDYDEERVTGPDEAVPISRLAHAASVVRPGTAAPHPQPQPAPASTSKATSKKVSPRRTATTSHPQALPLTRCVPLHDVARACRCVCLCGLAAPPWRRVSLRGRFNLARSYSIRRGKKVLSGRPKGGAQPAVPRHDPAVCC